ncbi:MAG: hypothetical protein HOI35_07365 [Woeseia sp.]|jgi:hypothetical protein|nr:hypothetical protein [Woeseia sp.]MBT6209822.1 hypothetical protein [Woeseia sp.]
MPDRFVEHPASVVIMTNLYYAESPWLMPRNVEKAAALNWIEISLEGDSAHGFGEQLRSMDEELVDGWQVRASEKTGNPLYIRPTVMVIYREDQRFILDNVIPKRGEAGKGNYDLVVISQPWRARVGAEFKVTKVLSPLVKSLAPCGRAVTIQSAGHDPGLDLVQKIWPDEDPFAVNRHEVVKTLKGELGSNARHYNFSNASDDKAMLRYRMHTLPDEISASIGTSTLFAAWNAAIYVAQIEDDRLEPVIASGEYMEATADILHKNNGLWFNDEAFTVSRKRR